MTPPFVKGDRIKVTRDNGRTGFIEYLGTVESINGPGAIVVLDADPAKRFRMNMVGGFELPHENLIIRRYFLFGDIEKIPDLPADR